MRSRVAWLSVRGDGYPSANLEDRHENARNGDPTYTTPMPRSSLDGFLSAAGEFSSHPCPAALRKPSHLEHQLRLRPGCAACRKRGAVDSDRGAGGETDRQLQCIAKVVILYTEGALCRVMKPLRAAVAEGDKERADLEFVPAARRLSQHSKRYPARVGSA